MDCFWADICLSFVWRSFDLVVVWVVKIDLISVWGSVLYEQTKEVRASNPSHG